MTDTPSPAPEEAIRECPGCAGKSIEIMPKPWHAFCATCGWNGPCRLSREAAIAAWNRRAGGEPSVFAALQLLARIADMHSKEAPGSLVLWCDNAQHPETVLTLDYARAIRAALAQAEGE